MLMLAKKMVSKEMNHFLNRWGMPEALVKILNL